ncbi:hypothetical protein A0U40_13435 [[Bacillus] sp. KCTC 13219]|nr:hypothetical protein A0U40_13435 [[Bacillus] sp. KCTC 13219]
MAEQINRDFKGVWIPKEVWQAKDLGWTEKLLLVEIHSLDNEQGCFASNDYFSEFFELSKNRISKMVSSLKNKGYITVRMQYKEGTKSIDKRIIKVVKTKFYGIDTPIGENANTYRRKRQEGIGENANTPIGENAKDSNTVINNTFNNTESKREGDKPLPPSSQIDVSFLKIKTYFEQHIRPTTYRDAQDINKLLEYYKDADLIVEAIKIALDRGKPFINYIDGILKRWSVEQGINSYQDFLTKGGNYDATSGAQNRPNTPTFAGADEEFMRGLSKFSTK